MKSDTETEIGFFIIDNFRWTIEEPLLLSVDDARLIYQKLKCFFENEHRDNKVDVLCPSVKYPGTSFNKI